MELGIAWACSMCSFEIRPSPDFVRRVGTSFAERTVYEVSEIHVLDHVYELERSMEGIV